jgi:choline monooxygenase
MNRFQIDPDIRKAETLPASFYKSETLFEELKDSIFKKTWQWIGHEQLVPFSSSHYPFFLLENYLTEPLVLVRQENDDISILSNVCTHRGNIIVTNPSKDKQLICLYHGRRFDLEGNFKFMPEFKEALEFPRPCDSLKKFPLVKFGPHLFASLEPSFDFQKIVNTLKERVGFLPLHEFKEAPALHKDYLVNCHWALYCDNYLEGFHIPFVHNDLNAVLDYGNYQTLLYDHMTLQIGFTNSGQEVFDLPQDHIDHGKNVAAYYYWIFPNMMFNFYPWGLSINIVKPISLHKTKVSFISYIYDESKLGKGAGALLDKVEREDEFVVEGVHKGIQSSYYQSGRFSPTREQGVHHFHQLLAKYAR